MKGISLGGKTLKDDLMIIIKTTPTFLLYQHLNPKKVAYDYNNCHQINIFKS